MAVPCCNSDPTLNMSNAGRNRRTQVLETSFAPVPESSLNCAAKTPYVMVRRTEMEAWRAPTKGMRSSEALVPMMVQWAGSEDLRRGLET
jgi:hypothetical protein